MSFFDSIRKSAKNEYSSVVSDGVLAGDISGYIDTGSYILNAALSGSIYGGIPSNKVTAFAGDPSTGKTFYVLSCVSQFLKNNPTGGVMFFESESAISKEMFESRGIDSSRVHIFPVATIEDFRTQAVRVLDSYLETKESDRPPMMMCLDSLGNLSSNKEIQDTTAGKDTRDMTKSQLLKGAFRILTLKLGRANVPMLVTNHVYASIGGMFPEKVVAGGSGLVYCASSIATLSKAKEKEGTDVVGAIITAKMAKSRLTKEQIRVKTRLFFDTGLDRYYGLADLAIDAGIWSKVSTKIDVGNDKRYFEKHIYKNPEKFFTKEVLDKIDEHCKTVFTYSKHSEPDCDIEEELAQVEGI